MTNREELSYGPGATFPGVILTTAERSRPAWPRSPQPPEGSPTVVVVVLDDVGYGQIGCFGGLGGRVATPNLDRLAAGGLRFNNFHVSPMCSPTRAALLTGRNNHSVGVGSLMEVTTGFPGYNGRIPKDAAMLPALLGTRGFASAAMGKWHLTPGDEVTPIGPFDRWPLGQGFQRFYGFLTAVSDQWQPILWADNHCIGRPGEGRTDYHLSEDIRVHAVDWCREHDAVAPNRPFFLYVAFGALHQPHQVGEEWIEPYRGMFSAGWDVVRAETLERQKELGIVPAGTALPPRNDGVPAWDELGGDLRRLLERQMEVAAAFLTHTDHQVGELVRELERHGRLDDTFFLVMSDNGASGEGGPYGQFTTTRGFNRVGETVDYKVSRMDEWGSRASYPNYATGWAMAGNTPNRWYKQFTHEGGTRAPLIVHWPSGFAARGEIRSQFHAAVDVVPTVLEITKVPMPGTINGVTQRPLEGVSFAYTFGQADEPTRKVKQYFEMYGHRAIWSRGWKAVCAHWTNDNRRMFLGEAGGELAYGDLSRDAWELYHLDHDYSEAHDLAAEEPERLSELVDLWWSEAGRFQVLPLDDHAAGRVAQGGGGPGSLAIFERRDVYRYFGPIQLAPFTTPNLRRRPHRIEATVEAGTGVVLSEGGVEGGYAVAVLEGELVYVMNYLGQDVTVVRGGRVPPGRRRLVVDLRPRGEDELEVALAVDGTPAGEPTLVRANPVRYDARGGGLRIGSDPVGVFDGYAAPCIYSGVIDEVVITCDGPDTRDLAAELAIARSEQ